MRAKSTIKSSARTRPLAGLALIVSLLWVGTGCTSTDQPAGPGSVTAGAGPSDASQAPASSLGTEAVVAKGLAAPWSIAFWKSVALISERDAGKILRLNSDGSTKEIATIEGVKHGGEGGLLGLAVSSDNQLYVYSTGQTANRIQRFPLSGDANSVKLGAATTVLEGIPSSRTHNGGRLAFGPDGMLYATTGYAGQSDKAQDTASLAGKILRLKPDGGVPTDNPISGSLVYSFGHRNPQGLAWGADGTLYASEFGQNTWDELNIIKAGANYGWPEVEGISNNSKFQNPVQQWSTDQASPSGMTHYQGTLFIANLRGQVMRAVPTANPSQSTTYFLEKYGRLRDVVLSPTGQLWMLTNNTDGRGQPGAEDDRIISLKK